MSPAANPQEKWLPISGFEGLYEVSDHGRVRSVERLAPRPGGLFSIKARVMKPQCRRGAASVRLRRDGRSHARAVHRLVLMAFVGPCPAGMEGCHNDGDPSNNRLENLRWDTHVNNMADQIRHGTAARGERCGRSKYTAEQVRQVRAANKAGESRAAIAARMGIPISTVRHMISGYSWRHLDGEPPFNPRRQRGGR